MEEMVAMLVAVIMLIVIFGIPTYLDIKIRKLRKRLRKADDHIQELQRELQDQKDRLKTTENEWAVRLRIAEIENSDLQKRMDAERRHAEDVIESVEREKQLFVADLEREQQKCEAERLETNAAFVQLARNVKDPVQSSVYAEHVLKNTPALKPDSKLVYVPRDLSGKLYHREYIPCGIRNMVLASRDNVEAYGLKQCPECEQCALPVADLIVCAAPSGTQVYHAVDSMCSGYTAREIPLSKALARGLRPCSKCYPPRELPKVFF